MTALLIRKMGIEGITEKATNAVSAVLPNDALGAVKKVNLVRRLAQGDRAYRSISLLRFRTSSYSSAQAVNPREFRPMTDAIQRFLALLQASDTLIEQATKEEVAEVARVLALHVAHYRRRYGDISVEESLALFRIEKLDDDTAGNLADGFEVLIEVLKALGTPDGAH